MQMKLRNDKHLNIVIFCQNGNVSHSYEYCVGTYVRYETLPTL